MGRRRGRAGEPLVDQDGCADSASAFRVGEGRDTLAPSPAGETAGEELARKKHSCGAARLPADGAGDVPQGCGRPCGNGVIGKSNLLITPEHGPRVRVKALALEAGLPPAEGRADFDPCSSCAAPCWAPCPQGAFASGRYDRTRCRIQMKIDASTPLDPDDPAGYSISYCRLCEIACPIGEM